MMKEYDDRRGWLDEMRDAVGTEAAAALQRVAGGERRYIPSGLTSNWIAQAAGTEAARWLAERFVGEYLYIPLAETRSQKQARELREAVAAHPDASASQLAQKLGVVYRTIGKIRHELRAHAEGACAPLALKPSPRKKTDWIADFEEALGGAAVSCLMEAFGGRKINISLKAGGLLQERAGREAALWLAGRFGGRSLYIPNGGGAAARTAEERKSAVLARPQSSATRLAQELGVSAARVHQIRKSVPA